MVEMKNQNIVWPNFFIVGAPKAGTTSLYYYLKEIPGVFMSPVKEPNYFTRHAVQRDSFDVMTDVDEYLKLFSSARHNTAIGEASVCYLWDPASPELIHSQVPQARIIILLRDPVDRAYSDYLMKKKYSGMQTSFYSDLVRDYSSDVKLYGMSDLYVELGLYSEQVKRYLDRFGKENVKIIIFEEFIQNKESVINEVLDFLGVDQKVTKLSEQYNPYSEPKNRFSILLFALFRWLRRRNVKFYKILNLLPDSLTETFIEKHLFKRAKKPAI